MARSALRSHLSGSVPISIALHLFALLLFLIIPLTANMILPDPAAHLPDYMRVAPMPPPPPAVRARPPSAAPTPNAPTNPDLAPTTAPDAIKPEGAPPAVPDLGMPPGVGVPDGVGLVIGDRPVLVQPPDPPRPAGPVRVADLPVTPRKIGDVRPVYPEIARLTRIEGTVILEAVLATTGRVTQLRVIKSAPMFDQAALDAVRQWRYTPSLYGGHPVSVLMTITVRFTLQ
jgi:periplasmic protein TonB